MYDGLTQIERDLLFAKLARGSAELFEEAAHLRTLTPGRAMEWYGLTVSQFADTGYEAAFLAAEVLA